MDAPWDPLAPPGGPRPHPSWGYAEAPRAISRPDSADKLACDVCGRQDETLRFASYPYVFSVLLPTFHRAFEGLWCSRHRRLRLFLAGLISSTVGWLGPLGLLAAPVTLFRLLRGGEVPVERNLRLLGAVAQRKLAAGDVQGAARCLEALLQVHAHVYVPDHLHKLYVAQGARSERGGQGLLQAAGVTLLVAILVGLAGGLVDGASITLLSSAADPKAAFYLAAVNWIPLTTMATLGALVLRQVVEWALYSADCRRTSFAAGLAVSAAALALYGLAEGRMIGRVIHLVLSRQVALAWGEPLAVLGAAFAVGGVACILNTVHTGGGAGAFYLLLLLASGAGLLTATLSAALEVVRGRQRVAVAQERIAPPPAQNAAPGWLAIGSVAVALGLLLTFFPRQGIVSLFDALGHNRRGAELMDSGMLDEAIRQLEHAVLYRPDLAEAHWRLGEAYLNRGEPEQAIPRLEQAIHLQRFDSAAAHSYLGWAYLEAGRGEEAVEPFQRAVDLDPGLASAHEGLAWAYHALDRPDDAVAAFHEALRLDPECSAIYESYGYFQMQRQDYPAAITAFEAAIRLEPDNSEAHRGLAEAYASQHALDQAVEALRGAVSLDPWDVASRYQLALWYYERGDYALAIDELRTLARKAPDSGVFQAQLAIVHYHNCQPGQAEQALQRALELEGDDATTSYLLGLLYRDMHRFAEAEARLLKVSAQYPDAASVYAHLSYVYARQGRPDLALEMCDKILELQEDSPLGYVARADVYLSQEKPELALAEFRRAEGVSPEDWQVRRGVSATYLCLGQPEKALPEAEKAVKLNPFDAGAQINLALACQALGQVDRALKVARTASRLDPVYDAPYYVLGMCYAAKGNKAFAVGEFREFLRLYWDRPYMREYKAHAEAYLAGER